MNLQKYLPVLRLWLLKVGIIELEFCVVPLIFGFAGSRGVTSYRKFRATKL